MPIGFQAGLRLVDWVLSGASVDLDFANNRYFGSSGSSLSSYLSISRASIGNAKNSSGVWVPFSANTLRITDLGLLVEDARTNYLLQSDTPATQTTASLATGSYTLWVEGSGSALASGGSGTITGAASATVGSPNTFNVTVAGTVVVTVTGSLTRFQLENGAFASSYVLTTGTTATRAADNVTIAGNLSTVVTSGTASAVIDFKKTGFNANGDTSYQYLLMCTANANGLSARDVAVGSTAAGSLANFNTAISGGAGSLYNGSKLGGSWDQPTGLSVAINGNTIGTAASHSPDSINGSVSVGAGNSGSYSFGFFRRLTVWNNKLADATLQSLTT